MSEACLLVSMSMRKIGGVSVLKQLLKNKVCAQALTPALRLHADFGQSLRIVSSRATSLQLTSRWPCAYGCTGCARPLLVSVTSGSLSCPEGPPGPRMMWSFLLQVYLLILSVTTLSLLLAPVLWRAAIMRCVPRPERRLSL